MSIINFLRVPGGAFYMYKARYKVYLSKIQKSTDKAKAKICDEYSKSEAYEHIQFSESDGGGVF